MSNFPTEFLESVLDCTKIVFTPFTRGCVNKLAFQVRLLYSCCVVVPQTSANDIDSCNNNETGRLVFLL